MMAVTTTPDGPILGGGLTWPRNNLAPACSKVYGLEPPCLVTFLVDGTAIEEITWHLRPV